MWCPLSTDDVRRVRDVVAAYVQAIESELARRFPPDATTDDFWSHAQGCCIRGRHRTQASRSRAENLGA